ncbi:MAG: hypothetical protein ACSW8F_04660 [bacterium]
MLEKEVENLKQEVFDAVKARLLEEAEKKVRREMKRKMRRAALRALWMCLLTFAAVTLYLHRHVLRAWLLNEPLPQPPKSHPCHKWCGEE